VLLKTDMLGVWASHYAGRAGVDNPLVSPLYGAFKGFPPLLIQVGREEVLLDDSLRVAEKAREAGVDVTLSVWDGVWHVWPALGDLIPESRLAFEEMGRFLAAKLRGGS